MGADEVPLAELIVVCASFNSLHSLYCTFPDCIGCYNNNTCCCIEQEGQCCKPTTQENADEACCTICEQSCKCVKPSTCCMTVDQCFCCDSRWACPPIGPDIVVALTCLPGFVVYPQTGCCMNAGELKGDDARVRDYESGAPAAPDAAQAAINVNATNDPDAHVITIEPHAAMRRSALPRVRCTAAAAVED